MHISCYFIYYRIDARHVEPARATVNQLLTQLKSLTGIQGRCLRKTGEPLLWMEIYDNVADPARFEATLESALTEARFDRYLQHGANRKVERFEACV